jgi:hypothetical protein
MMTSGSCGENHETVCINHATSDKFGCVASVAATNGCVACITMGKVGWAFCNLNNERLPRCSHEQDSCSRTQSCESRCELKQAQTNGNP